MSLASNRWYQKNKERVVKERRQQRQKKRHPSNPVMCRICNVTIGINGMSFHLKKMHDIELKSYIAQHLGDFKQFGVERIFREKHNRI